jgi:hypothetical protein
MDRVVSVFYWPTVLWVEHPALTLIPVLVFGAASWHLRRTGRRSRGLLVVTALWLAYAVYEGVMFVWAQQVIAPIRSTDCVRSAMWSRGWVVNWWRRSEGRTGSDAAKGRSGCLVRAGHRDASISADFLARVRALREASLARPANPR